MDQDAINLAKAIRQTESGGNFNAKGKSGESGAYQWTADTWKAHAKEALGNENAPMTPDNQNAVAYTIIKKRKDAGLNPAQIAAEWNSGSATGWENKRGTNKYGVQYDVPKYVKSVTDAYQQYKSGNQNPSLTPHPSSVGNDLSKPFSSGMVSLGFNTPVSDQANPQQTPQSGPSILPKGGEILDELKQNLSKRGSEIAGGGAALASGLSGNAAGLIHGPLQIAGGIAGGIGDIANAGLELIPGVQGAEKLVGQGAQKVMETQTGKDAASLFKDFSQSHPEIAKDIGAGVNVLAAIPILRGLGLVKGAVESAATSALRSRIAPIAENEIKEAAGVKVQRAIDNAERRGIHPVREMVGEQRYLPEVVENPSGGYMYASKKPLKEIEKELNLNEEDLQQKLDTVIRKNVMVSLSAEKKRILKDIQKEYSLDPNFNKVERSVNDIFESLQASSGGRDMISLNEYNGVKRKIRNGAYNVEGVKPSVAAGINSDIGNSMMGRIEKIAEENGVTGVRELNKQMSKKIEIKKVLNAIDEKKIKQEREGLVRRGVKALTPDILHPLVTRSPKSAVGKISRYRRPIPTLKTAAKKLVGGLAAQQLVK